MHKIGLEMGARYLGKQITNGGSFDIEMKIDYVDLEQDIMSGTFIIHNLSDKYEMLATYFESTIFGAEIDSLDTKNHDTSTLSMFPEWRSTLISRRNGSPSETSDFLFMKIKELFLLPDPNIKNIPGASIEGYYYCCYYKKLDCFTGHYFYRNSTSQISQQILLERVTIRTSEKASFA